MTCPGDLLTVAVLAGGKGNRLQGQDKGLIAWQGRPFIEHVLDTIESATSNIIVSANRHLDRYRQYGYPVIMDDIEGYAGPLAGMLSALKLVQTPYVLTLPCDAPLLEQDIIGAFCHKHLQEQQLLYVAETAEGLQPVYAMIHNSLVGNMQSFLEQGNRKTRDWMLANDACKVKFDRHGNSFLNVNTTDDLQLLG